MPFDWNRTEVWIGLLFGLPSFLLLFFTGNQTIAFVVLAAVILLIYGTYLLNRSEFTILEIEKTLVIKNKQGSKATLTRQQRAVCNHKGLTEFWCGGIGATGTVNEIRIDQKKPHAVEESCRLYRICKRFHPPLKRGEKFETLISYVVTDSFSDDVESLHHSTDYVTRKLKMKVQLPAARKCKSAKAYTCLNQHPQKKLPMPIVSDDGRHITLEISRPRKGYEYVVEWEW